MRWRHASPAIGDPTSVGMMALDRKFGAVVKQPVENMDCLGSVGDSYDNALAETVIGLFKTEVIHRRGPWRSFETVEFATLEWTDWFNIRLLLEPIGNIPPAEAESAYYATLEAMPIAA